LNADNHLLIRLMFVTMGCYYSHFTGR
jgi:hypothetical protein